MALYADYEAYEKAVLNLTNGAPHCGKVLLPFMYAVALNEPIKHVFLGDTLGDDCLFIELPSGSLRVWDDGQSCCESRYATTDDELDTFAGAKLVGIELVNVPDADTELIDEYHEQVFVKIETTAGTITLVTHNEHNGYYGGFHIRTSWRDHRGSNA